ncbi:serine/threonine-protein kinase [Nannocystis pusilla]|uniref:serine/threonine-protein kinase n=1 Tax=Nannocystis pusilla TaxID=889268 RepID=UPI003B7A9617
MRAGWAGRAASPTVRGQAAHGRRHPARSGRSDDLRAAADPRRRAPRRHAGADRPLPGDAQAGPGRHGDRLRRLRSAARPPRRHQAAAQRIKGRSLSVGQARLQREAQTLARLSHPNVVQVYEVGRYGDDVFIAMELVPGKTLRTWLKSQAPTWRQVVRVFRQAGEGLAAAHAFGIVHRDFKPENVLVGEDGRVRVVDFGLARLEEPDAEAEEHPRSATSA